jgi:hypothetical protein
MEASISLAYVFDKAVFCFFPRLFLGNECLMSCCLFVSRNLLLNAYTPPKSEKCQTFVYARVSAINDRNTWAPAMLQNVSIQVPGLWSSSSSPHTRGREIHGTQYPSIPQHWIALFQSMSKDKISSRSCKRRSNEETVSYNRWNGLGIAVPDQREPQGPSLLDRE